MIVRLVTPCWNVKVPLVAIKSSCSAVSPASILVLKSIVWSATASPLRVTVNCSWPPSSTSTESIANCVLSSSGASGPSGPSGSGPVPSSTIVSVPSGSIIDAPLVGLDNWMVSVSGPSRILSAVVSTAITTSVTPSSKVTVVATAVKSLASAVSDAPMMVCTSTV